MTYWRELLSGAESTFEVASLEQNNSVYLLFLIGPTLTRVLSQIPSYEYISGISNRDGFWDSLRGFWDAFKGYLSTAAIKTVEPLYGSRSARRTHGRLDR
jgi:hypothetical protein